MELAALEGAASPCLTSSIPSIDLSIMFGSLMLVTFLDFG
jgi:hypothetical protein